ncbi:NifU family protein [Rickettsiales bacterium]|nr:NifU family protein [Rickettsiales bacterium]
MFIQTENTPNPSTLKFIPEKNILKKGNLEFKSKIEAKNSPLAMKLFENEDVKSVFFGIDFITITKSDSVDWEIVKPDILSKIMNFLSSGLPVVNDGDISESDKVENKDKYNKEDLKIVEQIQELLEEKIRPAVAQDGGDIRFVKFEDHIVFLELRGSCAGCPSSTLTLKSGIENMLKYYIPEIKSVEAVN